MDRGTRAMAKVMSISGMTDEQRDEIVKSRAHSKQIGTTKGKDGKCISGRGLKWDDYAIDVRRYVIMSLINRGKSYTETRLEIMQRWDIARTTAENYIKDALGAVGEINEMLRLQWRDVQLERLQKIIDDALAHGDRKSALAANEQINKITGQYVTKVEADVKEDSTVKFDFGV